MALDITPEQKNFIHNHTFMILTEATNEQWQAWYQIVKGWMESYPIEYESWLSSHYTTDVVIMKMLDKGLPVETVIGVLSVICGSLGHNPKR